MPKINIRIRITCLSTELGLKNPSCMHWGPSVISLLVRIMTGAESSLKPRCLTKKTVNKNVSKRRGSTPVGRCSYYIGYWQCIRR